MATIDDVREIALALPGVEEHFGGHNHAEVWRTPKGQIAWVRGPHGRDREDLAERGLQWPEGLVLGIRTTDVEEQRALVESEPEAFFITSHFEGYPAVLVRLDEISRDRLEEAIAGAWLIRVSRTAAKAWLAERGLG